MSGLKRKGCPDNAGIDVRIAPVYAIGALAQASVESAGFVVVTSRCGLELVQKAIRAKITTLVTLSAPTSMAVDWARQYQLNLIHLPHHSSPRVYSGL